MLDRIPASLTFSFTICNFCFKEITSIKSHACSVKMWNNMRGVGGVNTAFAMSYNCLNAAWHAVFSGAPFLQQISPTPASLTGVFFLVMALVCHVAPWSLIGVREWWGDCESCNEWLTSFSYSSNHSLGPPTSLPPSRAPYGGICICHVCSLTSWDFFFPAAVSTHFFFLRITGINLKNESKYWSSESL